MNRILPKIRAILIISLFILSGKSVVAQNGFENALTYTFYICSGSFQNIGVNPQSGVLFNWLNNPSLGGADNEPERLFFATTTEFDTLPFSYLVYRRTVSGAEYIDSVHVFVLPPPEGIVLPFSDTTICFGQSVNLPIQLPPGYSFSSSTIFVNPIVNPTNDSTFLLQPEISTDYGFFFRDSNGCQSNINIFKILVIEIPSVSIEPIDPIYCTESDSILLNGSPSGGFFSGPGVIDSLFYPSLAGDGFHLISYTYSTGLCSFTNQISTTVISFPDFGFIELPTFCPSDEPVNLASFIQIPNTLVSGPGIVNSILFPSQLQEGSYEAVISINLGAGCENSDTIPFFIKPAPPKPNILTFTGFTEFCFDDSLLVGVLPFTNVLWSNGNTTNEFFIDSTQTLWVQYTNGVGCTNRDTLTLTELQPVVVSLNSPTYPNGFNISSFGLSDGTIELSASGGFEPYGYALVSGEAISSPYTNLPSAWYTVVVNDARNCKALDSIFLTQPPFSPPTDPVSPNAIRIPNSFTPNGDGFNDAFVIQNIQFASENKLSIFNRWGQLVFSANNYQNNWFGEANNQVTESTYFYIFEDLTNKQSFKGYINVIKKR